MKTESHLMKLASAFLNLAHRGAEPAEVAARYEALRKWRNELARTRNVRPFTILSNRTLASDCRRVSIE